MMSRTVPGRDAAEAEVQGGLRLLQRGHAPHPLQQDQQPGHGHSQHQDQQEVLTYTPHCTKTLYTLRKSSDNTRILQCTVLVHTIIESKGKNTDLIQRVSGELLTFIFRRKLSVPPPPLLILLNEKFQKIE